MKSIVDVVKEADAAAAATLREHAFEPAAIVRLMLIEDRGAIQRVHTGAFAVPAEHRADAAEALRSLADDLDRLVADGAGVAS